MPNLGYIKKGSKRIPNINDGASLKLYHYNDGQYDYFYFDQNQEHLFAKSGKVYNTYAEAMAAAEYFLKVLLNYGQVWIIYNSENEGAYTDLYYPITGIYHYYNEDVNTVMFQVSDTENTYSLI